MPPARCRPFCWRPFDAARPMPLALAAARSLFVTCSLSLAQCRSSSPSLKAMLLLFMRAPFASAVERALF